jgi:hypothetical protein
VIKGPTVVLTLRRKGNVCRDRKRIKFKGSGNQVEVEK